MEFFSVVGVFHLLQVLSSMDHWDCNIFMLNTGFHYAQFLFKAPFSVFWCSQYDSLWAGRSRNQILVGGGILHKSRTALQSTQPPVQWVPGLVPEVKAARVWH